MGPKIERRAGSTFTLKKTGGFTIRLYIEHSVTQPAARWSSALKLPKAGIARIPI